MPLVAALVCAAAGATRTRVKKFAAPVRAAVPPPHSAAMEQWTDKRTPGLAMPTSRTDVARAIRAMPAPDRLRLEAIARLRARAFPEGLGWADLLQEAIRRALDGSRAWPEGVPLVAFLAGVMRSVWSEQLRRPGFAALDPEMEDAAPGPERVLAAGEAVGAIFRLFASDPQVLCVLSGLADGLSAEEIRRAAGMSETEYDSARKRMRRALLRAGMAGGGR
jgi:DNA-directed RNA polymerase specialized sigma24 family protein